MRVELKILFNRLQTEVTFQLCCCHSKQSGHTLHSTLYCSRTRKIDQRGWHVGMAYSTIQDGLEFESTHVNNDNWMYDRGSHDVSRQAWLSWGSMAYWGIVSSMAQSVQQLLHWLALCCPAAQLKQSFLFVWNVFQSSGVDNLSHSDERCSALSQYTQLQRYRSCEWNTQSLGRGERFELPRFADVSTIGFVSVHLWRASKSFAKQSPAPITLHMCHQLAARQFQLLDDDVVCNSLHCF